MNRVASALLMIALVVCAIGWASCAGDPPPMLVDATSACAVKPLPNPCAKIDCNRVDTKRLT